MSLWDRLVYLILLSFLLPYINEISPTDFVRLNVKTQRIFAQPLAALSLVTELPTPQGLSLLRRSAACVTNAALGCDQRVPALRHTTPSGCLMRELAFVRVLAAFLPQQQAATLFRMNGC
jgi:hypothetical protein